VNSNQNHSLEVGHAGKGLEIRRDLRLGNMMCWLREFVEVKVLDFAEVSLMAILSDDKEGFLRDERVAYTDAGRAARQFGGVGNILCVIRITERCSELLTRPKASRKAIESITREGHSAQHNCEITEQVFKAKPLCWIKGYDENNRYACQTT